MVRHDLVFSVTPNLTESGHGTWELVTADRRMDIIITVSFESFFPNALKNAGFKSRYTNPHVN
jgi:hypothetical protein